MSELVFPNGHSYLRHHYADAEDEDVPEAWLANFIWTDRDDYLDWVANWKRLLRQKIVAIHTEQRIGRDPTRDHQERIEADLERRLLRVDCYNLFLLRMMGKMKSNQQKKSRFIP